MRLSSPRTEQVDARPRYALIDTVRGVGILLMIVYHFSWDLTFFGLADFQVFTDPWWIWFANVIVIIILGVMGVTQVMARRRGLTATAFFRRLGLIAAAAAAVSPASLWMDPASSVLFRNVGRAAGRCSVFVSVWSRFF